MHAFVLAAALVAAANPHLDKGGKMMNQINVFEPDFEFKEEMEACACLCGVSSGGGGGSKATLR